MMKMNLKQFARKYLRLFRDELASWQEISETFAEECKALGFVMDCGHGLEKAAGGSSDASMDWKVFGAAMGEIYDPRLLGNAIFSQWHFVDHGECPLTADRKRWFILAFQRLEELASAPEEGPFHGKLRKISLINRRPAEDFCHGGETVRQHLTVTSDGDVWLTSFDGAAPGAFWLTESKYGRIDREDWRKIASLLFRLFSRKNAPQTGGGWELLLTNRKGEIFLYRGGVHEDPKLLTFTSILQERLSLPELWGFQDMRRENRLLQVTVEICRQRPVGNDGFTEEKESLRLDRHERTVTYSRVKTDGSRLHAVYTMEQDLPRFMDSLRDALPEDRADWEEAREETDHEEDLPQCLVRIQWSRRPAAVYSFPYEESALPDHWEEFLTKIGAFCWEMGGGILSPFQERRGPYIYCAVEFTRGGKCYHYLTDDDSIRAGDEVIVPVGAAGERKVVRVVEKLYCTRATAPFPPEHTKKIIGKA